ncbi:VOC family protein [Glycomyces buryatensis]|uniref:VOC family protein n=1 Tax=Glycomyces buryatensis TaxID=2570927 RepID=A0A4S8QEM9_9ACTN|nr:VOC family protein [Glycomyces buryatensis]THV43053.1 VOC family protein [Glycomyces buryatensis]
MAARWVTAFWDFPSAGFEAGIDFWLQASGTTLSPRRGPDGEFATLVPPDGDAHLRVQRVQSGPGGNHLDLHVDDVELDAARAVALGANVLHREPGLIVLRSPGGLPLCLDTYKGESRIPAARTWPGGAGSRVDTYCVDIPPDRYESETHFWSTLTDWALKPGYGPEFLHLDRPVDLPVRIIFQLLADPAPHDPVRSHLDLTATDIDAVSEQHRLLGANPKGRFERWQVMEDPAGITYCITD